jgi:hypothetical protein
VDFNSSSAIRFLSDCISSAAAAEAAAAEAAEEGKGFEMDVRFVAEVTAGVARDADNAGFDGGGIELFVAEAADGRVVVRALEAVAGVPPIDGRGRGGLVTLLFAAASDARGFAPSVDDVEAVLIRLLRPLALALLAVVVGRVGGLLRLLLSAVPGDVLLPPATAELAVARVALVVVGFLIGGAVVREPGFASSLALIRDATEDIFVAFGDGDDNFSVPEENPS